MKKQLHLLRSSIARNLWAGLAVLLIGISQLHAQTANSYSFLATTGTFTPLVAPSASSLAVTADDAISTPVSLGFNFIYEGITYTQCGLSSNGYLIFGTAGTSAAGNDLSTTTTTLRPGCAPLWDDLQLSSGVGYQVSGTVGSRVFTAEWLNLEWNYTSSTSVISFQVKLYETTNVIEFIYRQEPNPYVPGTTGGASIGIMGVTSNNYISIQDPIANTISTTTAQNNIGVKPATGQIYRFTPPPPCTAPVDQPTALTFPSTFTTQINLSFTAAPSLPSAYLVVAYPAGSAVTLPTDGIVYNPGQTLGLGKVISAGPSLTANATGLTPATSYDFYVYSYNRNTSGNCSPGYNTIAPLMATHSSGAATSNITTATGGLWSAATTWVGGYVPSVYDTAYIASGATVTVDVAVTTPRLVLNSGAQVFLNANIVDSTSLEINTGATFNSSFGTVGRQLTVCGDIINNGALNMNRAGSILLLNGPAAQTVSGTGSFSLIPTLTVNNIAGVTLNANITVSNALNLTRGLVSGTGTMTLGNLSFSPTFAMASTGGTLACNAVSGLTGMFPGNATFTYSAPTPAAAITTGNELAISAPNIMNVTFNAITSANTTGNYTLGSNVTANNITISDTVDVGSFTMTVNGNATFSAPAQVFGAGTFTLNPNSTLTTASLMGITSAAAAGSVRTATRNYNAAANYTYNGAAGQVTGDGLPTLLTAGTVTISTTSGTTLSQSTQFWNLTLTTNLITGGFDATVSNNGNLGTSQVTGTGGFITTSTARLFLNNTNANGVIQNTPATTGNIINTGTRTFAPGTDIVIGGSAVATGNGFPVTDIDSLVLNQTTTVALTAPTSVNTLYITNTGRLTTTTNALTVLGTSAGSVARSNTGYIDGPLTRTIGVGSSGSFMFPLGVGATGGLGMEIINPVVTGSNVTLTAVVRNVPTGGTAGTGLTAIATNRYWAVSPVSGGTLASVGNVRIFETTLAALGASKKVGMTTSNATGIFNSIGGQLDSGTITILSSQTIPAFGSISDSTFFVLGAGVATGSFTGGTFTVGPTGAYFSLTSAIAAINERTSLTAPVILELQSTYNPSVETYPIVFRASLPTSATNTITIRPASGVSGVINFNAASYISTALFDFNGGSNITIDGRPGGTGTNRYIAINQQTIGAFPSVRFINDAQNNTLRYIAVSGQNTSTTSGLIVFGTGITAGNSNILIDNATINGMSNTANCIYSVGSTLPADNKNVTISNCNIFDFFVNGVSCIGILANGGNSNWTVNANNFYQTSVRSIFTVPAMTTATSFRAMNLNSSATNAVWTVTNNRIGGNIPGIPASVFVIGDSSSSLGHLIRPIDLSNAGTVAPTSVQGNTISNITLFTNGTDNFTGIGALQAGIYNLGNITPNVVGSTTTNGSIAIYNRGTSAITADAYRFSGTGGGLIQNNIASGIDVMEQGAQAAGGTATFRGLTVGGVTFLGAANSLTISGNTFGSTTLANSFRGLPNSTGGVGFYGIFVTGATGAAVTVTNNTISNLTTFALGFVTASSIRGIHVTGASSVSTTVSNNTITNFRNDAPNNATDLNTSVIGIQNSTSGVGVQIISNNTIHSLVSTYNGPVANAATGILYNSSNTSGNSRIDRNVIHSLETGSSNSFGVNLGVAFGTSATYSQVQNNFVRLGINVNGTTNNSNASMIGFYKQTANNTSIINNTVYIGGSPANTDSLALSTALYRLGSGTADTIMNNIFMNARSRTSGIGEYYAMYVTNATGMRADANLCFTNGTGGVPFRIGTTRVTTLQAWRAAQKPWSQRSANADPLFNAGITNSAATINFTLQAASPAARAAISLAHITVDQGGNARTATPAIGSYDVGLSALTAANDVYSPVFNFTKSGNRAAANTAFNNVTVTDIGMGVPTTGANAPKLWYKNATTNSAWASVAPTTNSGTANAAVFGYSFVWGAIGGAPAVNDKIIYYFVAQDAATAPNIWYSQYSATDPIHSNVSTQGTPPTLYDSFLVVTPLITTIDIPTNYPSLTGTGGFFEAVNGSALGGNTVVTISADVNETGVNELRSEGLSGFSLTIQPDATLRTLWGNSTGSLIRLNGVSKVTIDGGANRNLRIIDSIGTAPSGTVGAAIEFLGGCSNDTLVNCIIEGNASSTNRGTVTFGAGANTNILIANCDIRGLDSINRPANAIYSNNIANANITIGGTTARPGGNMIYDFSNAGINFASNGDNIVVGSLTVPTDGNQLYCRAGGSTMTYVNIAGAANNYLVANNKVYQKYGNYSSTVIGYSIAGNGSGHRITRNHFGGASADRSGPALISTGSNVTGISATVGISINTVIDSNYISNFGNSASSGVFGINLNGGNASIQKNIVGFGINAYDTVQNRFDNGLINIAGGNVVLIEDNKLGNTKYVRNSGDRTAGITVNGPLAPSGLIIRNNVIKDLYSDATSTTNSLYGVKGILIANINNNAIIEGNTIYNIYNTNTGSGAYVVTGISNVSTAMANATIRNNRIYNMGAVGTGTGTSAPTIYGIYFGVGGSNGHMVTNNQITLGNDSLGQSIIQGIRDEATSGVNTYNNNSIFINGRITAGANASHGIYRSSTVTMFTTNNLIYNKRTGGTGKNYALGTATTPGVVSANIQYNMMFADTASLVEYGTGVTVGWSGLGTFYTSSYNTNWAEKPATVLPELLFTDTLVGNLGIVGSNPEAWYVNGKGIRIIGQTGDFANASGVRSGSITSGAVDIGSVEFTPTSTPPDAYADKIPANNDSTQFFFASRMIAKMVWGPTGTVPTTVSAKYYSGVNPANTGAPKTYMNAYWNIDQTGGSGYTYTLTLMQDSAVLGTVDAVNELAITRYVGPGTLWRLVTGGTTANNVTGFMSANNLTNVGIFTGTDVNTNTLPVKYTSFTAETRENDVVLDWTTASEINNNGFEIERSVDGDKFEYVDFVKGAGNSSRMQAYAYNDADAFTVANSNVLYYRLKQIDFNGEFVYSAVVRVSKTAVESNALTVYPNPYNTDFSVSFTATNAGDASVEIVSIQGKTIATMNSSVVKGSNTIPVTQVAELNAGVYFVRLTVNGETQLLKVVKH